ncbi:class I SAM-dependent methyltransferase [Azospirillum sp.]|uniref:class I SAM-dependent methyltransferase n=1 Tax=Azospirillum sp. TaxID=34012 RepID=UPI003D717979
MQLTLPEALALADTHLTAGRAAEAKGLYARILDAAPGDPTAPRRLGVILAGEGDAAAAAELLGRAVRNEPNDAAAHRDLAAALDACGRAAEARASRQRAHWLLDAAKGLPGDDAPACRLCGGATRFRMFRTVRGRHVTGYFLCGACGSLQTEAPHWLEEAYAHTTVGPDYGICRRTLQLVIECFGLFTLLQLDGRRTFVDFGGGNGLFTRMMRDRGFNMLSYDKYQAPFYSDVYVVPDYAAAKPDVVTAFEVFEHLPNPGADIDALMAGRPDLVVFTTDTFDGQGPDWGYLAPETGQHVFFYGRAAFAWIAERYGMEFCDLGLLKVLASQRLVEERQAAGVSFDAVCARAADRAAFVPYATGLFANEQMRWQQAWVSTMTPPP